ncbi:MAG: hypothetical protein ACPG5B_02430 [Chitinophagales bacterium]
MEIKTIKNNTCVLKFGMRVLAIIFFSLIYLVSFGQDSIVGIYTSMGDELTFNINGTFTFKDSRFNLGQPFHGKWDRLNASKVYAKVDTSFGMITTFGDESYFDSFYFTSDINSDFFWGHFTFYSINNGKEDSVKRKAIYWKIGTFYSNGLLKSETKYARYNYIVTHYYPNGKVDEIIEYSKENRLKHGVFLKYNKNGRLLIYQYWENGKKKMDELYDYY